LREGGSIVPAYFLYAGTSGSSGGGGLPLLPRFNGKPRGRDDARGDEDDQVLFGVLFDVRTERSANK